MQEAVSSEVKLQDHRRSMPHGTRGGVNERLGWAGITGSELEKVVEMKADALFLFSGECFHESRCTHLE